MKKVEVSKPGVFVPFATIECEDNQVDEVKTKYSGYTFRVTDITAAKEAEREAIREIDALDLANANRLLNYPSTARQLRAAYLARRGDETLQKELDAEIEAVDLKFPLPEAQ